MNCSSRWIYRFVTAFASVEACSHGCSATAASGAEGHDVQAAQSLAAVTTLHAVPSGSSWSSFRDGLSALDPVDDDSDPDSLQERLWATFELATDFRMGGNCTYAGQVVMAVKGSGWRLCVAFHQLNPVLVPDLPRYAPWP